MSSHEPPKFLLAAATALAGVAVVAGIGVTGGASQAAVRPAQSGYTLYTEPDAGAGFIYNQINAAQTSIDMTMSELSDSTAEDDLTGAAARGVDVRVILDGNEKGVNQAAYNYLNNNGVNVVWSWDKYHDTGEKSIVFDGTTADIMTLNLASGSYAANRDFAVVDTDAADVSAVQSVFEADYAHQSVTPDVGSDLIWSPTSVPADLADLINNATASLQIYAKEMDDPAIVTDLASAAERGVDVQICGENVNGEYNSEYTELANAGVHISYYDTPGSFAVHGQVVLSDYGTSGAQIFIGSQDFSSTSLTGSRELGLIISDTGLETSVQLTFSIDFANGIPWT
jgi:cardiolipin synthase